jgi:hypothetical protein
MSEQQRELRLRILAAALLCVHGAVVLPTSEHGGTEGGALIGAYVTVSIC